MHTGINIGTSAAGIANPLDINVKELDNKMYELDDSDHIYDDPSLLVVDSCLKMPLPPTIDSYDILNREVDSKDAMETSHANSTAPAPQPAVGRGLGEVVSFSMSEGRYTSVGPTPTPRVKPAPMHVPPGYSTPRPLIPVARPAPKPPAVPRPQAPEKIVVADDGEETVVYFPLMKEAKAQENGTYQALVTPAPKDTTAQKDATVSPTTVNPTQQDATVSPTPAIEEEEYMDMKTPGTKTAEFPE